MAHTQTAVRRPPTPPAETQTLARRLGPYDAAAIIVSNVIGGGILFTPPQVAASVQNSWLFLGTWVTGGLLAFAGAMAYAELATLRLANYTFGGPGGQSSAPAPDPERCPVALARCP